jgi:hypothetical protein
VDPLAGVGRVLLGLRYLGGVGLNRGMKNSGGNYGRYRSGSFGCFFGGWLASPFRTVTSDIIGTWQSQLVARSAA